jgi:zinc transport system permease protein
MEIFQYEFIKNAVITAVLINIACGIVGTFVVTKRIVFISGGISHAAFGGIGLGYFLGLDPIITAIPFSILAAFGIGFIAKKTKVGEDAAIGILWAIGMSLGIIFINLTPGYAPDLFSYLFGNILTIPFNDLIIMVVLDMIIVVVTILFYKEFKAISFDEEFSKVAGVPVDLLYFLLLGMVALSVVILIKVVGIILVIALLTIPAAICRQFTNNIKTMIFLSMSTGIILTISGLWISYILDLASGATIIMVLGLAFILSYLAKYLFLSIKKYKSSKEFCK